MDDSNAKQRRGGLLTQHRCRFVQGIAVGLFGAFVISCVATSYDVRTNLLYEKKASTTTVDHKIADADAGITRNKPLLELPPGTKSIVMNIGSNVDPILPQSKAGPCALTIAFEPIVPDKIPAHPQILVVPAAISDSDYLATMHVYNTGGVSSSLSKAAKTGWWNEKENKGVPKIVPVIPFVTVLAAIPAHITIDMIDTDMQGFDFQTVRSAIDLLVERKVRYLKTEVYLNNTFYSYEGAENDLCRQWLPMMKTKGYTFVGLTAGGSHIASYNNQSALEMICDTKHNAPYVEGDALWVLNGVSGSGMEDLEPFAYKKIREGAAAEFTEAEYAACQQQG